MTPAVPYQLCMLCCTQVQLLMVEHMTILRCAADAPWSDPAWLQAAAGDLVSAKQLMVEAAIPQLPPEGAQACAQCC